MFLVFSNNLLKTMSVITDGISIDTDLSDSLFELHLVYRIAIIFLIKNKFIVFKQHLI